MDNRKELIGKNIKRHRINAGLTQEELAEKIRAHGIRISLKRMADIEIGKGKISLDDIFTLAYIFNIMAGTLLQGIDKAAEHISNDE